VNRRSIFLLALVLPVLPPVTAHSQLSPDWKACSDVGASIPVAESIAACTRLIESGKESAENRGIALANRCGGKVRLRDNDGAIADCGEAIRLAPRSVSARNNRGQAFLAQGSYPDALADFDAALGLRANHASASYGRAVTLHRMGRYDDALKAFDVALAAAPRDVSVLRARATLRADRREPAGAVEDYTGALKLDADDAPALEGRAGQYARLGRWSEALADYEALTRLRSTAAIHHARSCGAKVMLDRAREAIADCDRALASNARLSDALANRALARHALAEWQVAKADWNAALALVPVSPAFHYGLAMTLEATGDRDGAARGFAEARKWSKDDHAWADVEALYGRFRKR